MNNNQRNISIRVSNRLDIPIKIVNLIIRLYASETTKLIRKDKKIRVGNMITTYHPWYKEVDLKRKKTRVEKILATKNRKRNTKDNQIISLFLKENGLLSDYKIAKRLKVKQIRVKEVLDRYTKDIINDYIKYKSVRKTKNDTEGQVDEASYRSSLLRFQRQN